MDMNGGVIHPKIRSILDVYFLTNRAIPNIQIVLSQILEPVTTARVKNLCIYFAPSFCFPWLSILNVLHNILIIRFDDHVLLQNIEPMLVFVVFLQLPIRLVTVATNLA